MSDYSNVDIVERLERIEYLLRQVFGTFKCKSCGKATDQKYGDYRCYGCWSEEDHNRKDKSYNPNKIY